MSLSSLGFLQVGDSTFEPGQFIRTFFEPTRVSDCYAIHERRVNGELELYVCKQAYNPIAQAEDFWTLPKVDSTGGILQKIPTGGTAVYAHCYERSAVAVNGEGEWVSVADIFKRFQDGFPVGIELIHGALKVLNENESRLNMPDVQLPERSLGKRYSAVEEKIIKKSELKSWEEEVAKQFCLECAPVANPEKPFVSIGYCDDPEGIQREYAIRKGHDSQDSICFCWHGGQIYMAIRLGVRASLSRWEWADNLISVEGVAGSLEEDDITNEKIVLRAMEETKEELGLEPAATGMLLGSFFTAAEVTAEKSTSVLVEVDPSRPCVAHHSADEIQDTRFIELDDLLSACDEGAIIDERLEVSARLLKALYRYHNPLALPESDDKKIVIFGGTFDPFHKDHLHMAVECLNENQDSVVIVPAKQNPLKNYKPMMTNENRVDSIVATASEYPGMYVSVHEMESDAEVVYTADSIAQVRALMPDAKSISLLIGADLLQSMYRWVKVNELFAGLDGLVIAPRDQVLNTQLPSFQSLYTQDGWKLIQNAVILPETNNISSSRIKDLIHSAQHASPTEPMLPARVAKFFNPKEN